MIKDIVYWYSKKKKNANDIDQNENVQKRTLCLCWIRRIGINKLRLADYSRQVQLKEDILFVWGAGRMNEGSIV